MCFLKKVSKNKYVVKISIIMKVYKVKVNYFKEKSKQTLRLIIFSRYFPLNKLNIMHKKIDNLILAFVLIFPHFCQSFNIP
jgi:hypothetical protein